MIGSWPRTTSTRLSVSIEGVVWDRADRDRVHRGQLADDGMARVVRGDRESARRLGAGIKGLVVLKTRGSAFEGFPPR